MQQFVARDLRTDQRREHRGIGRVAIRSIIE